MPSREQLLHDIEEAAAAEGLQLELSSWQEAATALSADYLRQNKLVDVAAALQEWEEQRRRQEQQGQQQLQAAAAGIVV